MYGFPRKVVPAARYREKSVNVDNGASNVSAISNPSRWNRASRGIRTTNGWMQNPVTVGTRSIAPSTSTSARRIPSSSSASRIAVASRSRSPGSRLPPGKQICPL